MRHILVFVIMFLFISLFMVYAIQFNKIIAVIRYVVEPPGLDCAQVLKTSE